MVATLAAVRGIGRNPDRPGTNEVMRTMVEDAQVGGHVSSEVAAHTLAGVLNGLLLQCALIGSHDPARSQEDWLLDMVETVLAGVRC